MRHTKAISQQNSHIVGKNSVGFGNWTFEISQEDVREQNERKRVGERERGSCSQLGVLQVEAGKVYGQHIQINLTRATDSSPSCHAHIVRRTARDTEREREGVSGRWKSKTAQG